ncbi:MAG: GAF domain-containing sensor histidine kinase [Candidatus Omnitrophica bacterium]|nr:GAF domain-containing sensor histidine kinase [Candidatus Omnitrophota bacterium]
MNTVTLPAAQVDLTPILSIFCLTLLTAAGTLLYFLINKNEELRDLKAAHAKIMLSFNELDEQAKLIVKTDLELNKAQEELDRRLNGLNTLQKLARTMRTSLDENEAFQRIDPKLMTELGFSRTLAVAINENEALVCRTAINFPSTHIDTTLKTLKTNSAILEALKNGTVFSSLSTAPKARAAIVSLFETEHFILAPLLTQAGLAGFLLTGNQYHASPITEGDEELISILASQLAQTIENAHLFEQVYRSSQMLETKVNDRTRELSFALKQVEEISRKKTEFISAVSHELRTPLTSIKGYASILMTGKIGEIPDAVKERLGKINLHSDNLVKLINDLLDIARIESGRVEMKTTRQPIKPMLTNIADLLTPQLSAKMLILRVQIQADTPEIEFDASQVERVFINLISNAIKFTKPGGIITINAIPQWDKQILLCEVADTGIGIKKEDVAKVFDEFYRVDNEINMNVKGTGLGLALAKNIVEAHGGRMWVSSEINIGTTFHFTLPFNRVTKEQPQSI